MDSTTSAPPVLSTPAEHILEEQAPAAASSPGSALSEEQLYIQYEIKRTVQEIREGRWKRIALQFPDEMLVDAPRVYERLRDGLKRERTSDKTRTVKDKEGRVEHVTQGVERTTLVASKAREPIPGKDELDEKLTILADTSYGACCVDEVAAEHVEADVVVHYGRSCLSSTVRLPVIYVFTTKPLDSDAVVRSFKETYKDTSEKVCLMADIPYSYHVPELYRLLREEGYENVYATEVVRDPSSLLPNRTIPPEVLEDPEKLKDYSVFHISDPPTSLLLILSSRVKRVHIFPTDQASLSPTAEVPEASTTALLRRRYALLTRISTIPIFGILINTLSVSNYMAALKHCQDLIAAAGKKSYVFVVGKVNTAKIANFAEVGAWVVIGCWESSLIESKEFFAPLVTPFELEVALQGDESRKWGGEWVGNFEELLGRDGEVGDVDGVAGNGASGESRGNWDDQPSDDEPPEFDLRTGRYVSRSRPMGRPKATTLDQLSATEQPPTVGTAPPSSEIVQRPKAKVATINGTLSPAADFLRSKRTWQGLGSDYDVSYERDEEGRIRGAAVEEGRSGVARGYAVGAEGEG